MKVIGNIKNCACRRVVFALCLMGISSGGLAGESNLLQNSGFERDNSYGQAVGWWYEGAAGRATWAAHGGNAGSSFYPAGNTFGAFGQDCAIETSKGRAVEFSIDAKMEPNYVNEETTVSMQFLASGQVVGTITTNVYAFLNANRNMWIPIRVRSVDVPADATFLRVRMAYENGCVPDGQALATCQWDDARLVQAIDEGELALIRLPTQASTPTVARDNNMNSELATPTSEPAVSKGADTPTLPGNIAPNAGFERSDDKGVPEGWATFDNLGQKIAVTEGNPRTGQRSLSIRAVNRPGAFQGLYCNLRVEEGADYSFLAFATADRNDRLGGSAHGQLMIEWLNKDNREISKEISSSWDQNLSRLRWESIRIERARAPRSAVSARFGIHWSDGPQKASGGILVDDVYIRKL